MGGGAGARPSGGGVDGVVKPRKQGNSALLEAAPSGRGTAGAEAPTCARIR
jgi:hypothetical protein